MTDYTFDIDTQEEAEILQKRLATLAPEQRCPLIGDLCMKQCVCYEGPYIQNHEGKFRVGKGYCNNAMFSGEVFGRITQDF
jgi:hypothetical protein